MNPLEFIRVAVGIMCCLIFIGIPLMALHPGSGLGFAAAMGGSDHSAIQGAYAGFGLQLLIGLIGLFGWMAYIVRKIMR